MTKYKRVCWRRYWSYLHSQWIKMYLIIVHIVFFIFLF